jgi:hypothetical protein
MTILCGMVVNRMRMLGVSVKMMKALTVKDTVTLIGTGGQNLANNGKIFFF